MLRQWLAGISLCWAAITATPFVAVGNNELGQAFLEANGREDPLKDFVSDVTRNKDTAKKENGSDHPRFPVIGDNWDSSFEDDVPESLGRPSWFTSALLARRLLALSSVGAVSTVYPPSDSYRGPPGLEGVPISLPEYFADCPGVLDDEEEGNPIFLGLYVSTTFRNIASGSNVSLAIDWWDQLNKTEPLYPGFPLSPAGLPRVSLLGYVERIDSSIDKNTQHELEACFLAAHPDAKVWLPGAPNSPHAGFWARMVVTHAFWIGGFGDLAQIGWLNMTEWKGIGRHRSAAGIGDGRGWESVRLPGEGDH
ncbi:hypothetical protein VTN49DRAFT_3619 [Thermomyces lanuginosus]|uniref:uncharacterized protein n=1 Tax=Thermomyces lanuginosus TaxID=5541 RepID=UPI0037437C8C